MCVDRDCIRSAGRRRGCLKRLSDFASDFVNYGSALLGIVAASARREALCLAACIGVRLHGVLGVECSNHSVPTIFFNDLAAFERLCCFCHSDFPSDLGVFHHASLRFRIVSAGARESVADTLFAAAIS